MAQNTEQTDHASLKVQLKTCEDKLIQAATFGNQLLEEKRKLKNENEVLKQEKYSAQLGLDAKTKEVQMLTSEIDFQKGGLDSAEREMKQLRSENSVLSKKVKEITDEHKELSNAMETVTLDNKAYGNRIAQLELELENCRNSLQVSLNEMNTEELMKLTNQLQDVKKEKTQVVSHASSLEESLGKAKEREGKLTDLVQNLKEELEECDLQKEYYLSIVEKNKEEASELMAEIELLKLQQVDVNKRGNSIFGEVEDQRKLMERELLVFKKRYQILHEIHARRKVDLQKAKKQILMLLNVITTKVDGKYIEDIENRLCAAHKEIENLTQKLYSRPKLETKPSLSQDEALTQNDEYKYMRTIIMQTQNKIEELEKELHHVRMMKMAESDKLFQTKHELYTSEKNAQTLKVEMFKLKQKIQELSESPLDDALLPLSEKEESELKKEQSFLFCENKENSQVGRNLSLNSSKLDKNSSFNLSKDQTLMPPPPPRGVKHTQAVNAKNKDVTSTNVNVKNKDVSHTKVITAGNCAQQ